MEILINILGIPVRWLSFSLEGVPNLQKVGVNKIAPPPISTTKML